MITLEPDGPLHRHRSLASRTLDIAQEHLHQVLLHDVARIVRDALPTATHLVLEVRDPYVQPRNRVDLLRIDGPGGAALWIRDQELHAPLADYRTNEGTPWTTIVSHLERVLTTAIGTYPADEWWEPEGDEPTTVFCCALPTAADVAAIQVEQPRNLVACLVDDDLWPLGAQGLLSRPTPRPRMAVAGVTITASLGDDNVLTIDIDPTLLHAMVLPSQRGGGVRVHLVDTGTAVPAPARFSGDAEGAEGELEMCATEGCGGSLQDGEGWNGLCGTCADQLDAAEHSDPADTPADTPEETRDTAPDTGAPIGQTREPIGHAGTALVVAHSVLAAPVTPQQRLARPAPAPDVPVTGSRALEDLLPWFDGDGEMRYRDTEDDDRHDNGRRAGFAALAVAAYALRVGAISDANDEAPETVISDLLGDLRHLADSLRLDFAELDRHGHGHYTAELHGDD